jgi:hypothetical protein
MANLTIADYYPTDPSRFILSRDDIVLDANEPMYTFVNLTNHLGEYMLPTPGKLLMKVMYDTFSMIPNYKESGVFSLESLLTMAKKSYKGTNLDTMRSRMYKDVFPCPISFATNVRPFAITSTLDMKDYQKASPAVTVPAVMVGRCDSEDDDLRIPENKFLLGENVSQYGPDTDLCVRLNVFLLLTSKWTCKILITRKYDAGHWLSTSEEAKTFVNDDKCVYVCYIRLGYHYDDRHGKRIVTRLQDGTYRLHNFVFKPDQSWTVHQIIAGSALPARKPGLYLGERNIPISRLLKHTHEYKSQVVAFTEATKTQITIMTSTEHTSSTRPNRGLPSPYKKRGRSRHYTLQRKLKKTGGADYLPSLEQALNDIVGADRRHLVQVYTEVPFPSMSRRIRSSRADAVLYQPGDPVILIEYKTTEQRNTKPQPQHTRQTERCYDNFLRVANYAAHRPEFRITEAKKPPMKLYSLLTVRGLGGDKRTDTTVASGGRPGTLIPATVRYDNVFKKLCDKRFFY